MVFFVLRNPFGHCNTLSRCILFIKDKPIRVEVGKLHSIAGDVLAPSKTSCYAPRFSTLFKSRTVLEGHRFLYRTNKNNSFSSRLMATRTSKKKNNIPWYFASMVITMVGVSFAGVPLYKIFCQQMGLGGNAELARIENAEKVLEMEKIPDRKITVSFSADKQSNLRWNFRPQQANVEVSPGETALAFYTAKNPTEEPIVGVATYSVVPYAAALYFHKIQCFCFEEQILNPHEQVDMPVFFYIDPEYDVDPALEGEDQITLSYTFFEAKAGEPLPLPGYIQSHYKQNVSS